MSEPEPITVHENDVLMGRGGKNNQHSGNEKLRELAREQSANYRESTKKGKSSISRDLVQKMRDMVPPARFLKRNSTSGEWEDVGDDIAREKASQVLRDAVALLPEEAGGVRRHVDDDDEDDVEPIAVRPTAGAAATATTTMPTQVTQDEMDRKPSAAAGIGGRMMMMGPPDDHHRRMPSSISATSSFPPASPVESYSRKRQRYYYQQYPEYVPQHPYHGYHERYPPPPPPPPLPHGEGYVPDSPARRRRYDYTTHPRYHPDYRDTSSPPPDYSPPPRADHMMGYPPHPHYHTAPPPSHYHAPHVRGTTTSLDSSPIGSSRARHHESSYPTPVVRRPHSLPGYLPSTQPHPSHRQHNEFLPPPPPPTAGGRMPYSPPPSGGRMPYSPQRPTSMGADEPPPPPPPYGVHHHPYSGPQQRHYHHQPPPSHPPPAPSHPGSPMVRRPLPAGDDNRQASSASAQSLLGDVASSTGINDFDLFNGELLASDPESSPRVPPSAYHHRHYQGRPPYPPPVDDGPRRWYQNQQQYDLSLPGISSPQPQSAPEQQPPRGSEPGSPAPEA
ncbi:hypothetical protein ACA910_009843 [Epithemia clementina (nom. ined.)]